MFRKKQHENPALVKAINDALADLDELNAGTPEYAAIVDQLTKLHAFTSLPKPSVVSKDQLVTVAGNLLGIVAILGFEKSNVITSKALSFVLKPKI